MTHSELDGLRSLSQESMVRKCREFARQAERNAALAEDMASRDVFLAVARNFSVFAEGLAKGPDLSQ